jgi:hypothetical protein
MLLEVGMVKQTQSRKIHIRINEIKIIITKV